MSDKKVPHVHAAVIKAWADGAQIQWLRSDHTWGDTSAPYWEESRQYRVKPVPDLKMAAQVHHLLVGGGIPKILSWILAEGDAGGFRNLLLTFDGETGKLKDAQVLATE